MNYLIVIPMVIRGDIELLSDSLEGFNTIDNECVTEGNRHAILLWKKVEYISDEIAIEDMKRYRSWNLSIQYFGRGHRKSGHIMLHSIEKDCAVWSQYDDNINYVFDGIASCNEVYRKYGMEF